MVFFTILLTWSLWQLVIKENGQLSASITGLDKHLYRLRLYLALTLAVGLSAFFWLPVAFESESVNLGTLIGEGSHFDFRNNFIQLSELFGGVKLIDWGATEPDYSLNLGLAQVVLGLAGVVALFIARTKARKQGVFHLLALILLLFLMLRQSTMLWEMIPVLPFLQFPWRLLGAAAVFMFVFLIILSLTGVYLLAVFLPLWVSALIVSGILLLVGGILAGVGASILRKLDPKPHKTIRTFQQNVNWLKGQISR